MREGIELMFIDQKVFESEVIFCKSIAIKLGFKKTVIDFMSRNFGTMPREELKRVVLVEYALT